MRGRLVVLSGPSGVGKDTLLDRWAGKDPNVARVVAATTRKPRKGEVHGVHYWFMGSAEFRAKRSAGAFLESKKVHGNWYGSPVEQVDALIAAGKTTVLKIDVQGAFEVRRLRPEALLLFIRPPSMEELERRLRSRRSETPAKVRKRLLVARHEIGRSKRYDVVVVNDDLDRAVEEVRRAVGG